MVSRTEIFTPSVIVILRDINHRKSRFSLTPKFQRNNKNNTQKSKQSSAAFFANRKI